MNITLFRLKTSSYPLNYFGQGMAAATPCHMGSSATAWKRMIVVNKVKCIMKTALLILLHSSEKKARSRNPGEVLLVVLANNSCDVLKKLCFFHCSREIR